MTSTQKRWVEVPFFVLLVWLFQSLQISILILPFNAGAIQALPVLILYCAVTRSWARAVTLAALFAYMDSFTMEVNTLLFIVVQIWTALLLKIVARSFTVDSRFSFAALAVIGGFFSKTLIWITLSAWSKGAPLSQYVITSGVSAIMTGVMAFFLLPIFLAWDDYFEHVPIESAELSGDFLKPSF